MTSLPPCCSDLDDRWPWHQRLPDLQLITLSFDANALQAEDFERSGIVPPDVVRHAKAKRQAEYLAGRLCAREALQSLTGYPGIPGTDSDRAPLWPASSVGSITHSHGQAAAIVGNKDSYQSLGIDIERHMPDNRAEKLLSQILTPDEVTRFKGDMRINPGPFLTGIFSLKESLFKALYPLTRQRFYFQHAEVLEWHPDGSTRLRLLKTLSKDWAKGIKLTGYIAELPGATFSLIPISTKSRL